MIFPCLFNFHSLQIWDFSRKITVTFLLHFKYERFEKKIWRTSFEKELVLQTTLHFSFSFQGNKSFQKNHYFSSHFKYDRFEKKNDVVVFHQILFYQELRTLIMRTFHDEITTFISYILNMRDLKKNLRYFSAFNSIFLFILNMRFLRKKMTL